MKAFRRCKRCRFVDVGNNCRARRRGAGALHRHNTMTLCIISPLRVYARAFTP